MSFRDLWIKRFPTSYFRSYELRNRINYEIHKYISLIPIGIGLGHYPEPCQSPIFKKKLTVFFRTRTMVKSSIDRPSSFPLLMQGKNLSSSISTIRNPKYFFGQATPRFELGIKDLQSPALPLGHAAKNPIKNLENSKYSSTFSYKKPLSFILNIILLTFFQSFSKNLFLLFLIQFLLFSSIDSILKHTLLTQ